MGTPLQVQYRTIFEHPYHRFCVFNPVRTRLLCSVRLIHPNAFLNNSYTDSHRFAPPWMGSCECLGRLCLRSVERNLDDPYHTFLVFALLLLGVVQVSWLSLKARARVILVDRFSLWMNSARPGRARLLGQPFCVCRRATLGNSDHLAAAWCSINDEIADAIT